MGFQKAKVITNAMFAPLAPINVFHREMQQSTYSPAEEYKNQHILFRTQFEVSQRVDTTLRISADDYYKVYINGVFVTQGPAPSYHFAYCYNEIEVSSYLRQGTNTIAVHTYYQGLINRVWVSGDLRQMLICELETSDRILVATDECWKTKRHTGFFACGQPYGYETGFCEGYNANAPEVHFAACDFVDDAWEYAMEKQYSDYQFIKQTTKQLAVYPIKPKQIQKNKDGYFIDVGQEIVGYLTFCAKGKQNDEIIIQSGEELHKDGSVRYQMRCNCIFEEKFILGEGECQYQQYDYKAFRYLQLKIPESASVSLDRLEIIVRHYPVTQFLPCPHPEKAVQKIWTLCADTIYYGTQEILMDCPTREKGQYLGDATISAIATTILQQDTTFMRKVLRDFANTTFISQSLMSVANASLMQEIADYSLQFPLQVWWLYQYDHDLDFLREMQPIVAGILEDFAQYERADGLIDGVTDLWNLVDWPRNLRDDYDFPLTLPIGPGVHNVLNAFYYGAQLAYEKINATLGIVTPSKSAQILASFQRAFFNPATQRYVDCENSMHSSLHSNVLPLFFDMPPQEAHPSILALIDQKGIQTCGVYMALFVLIALRNIGEEERMYNQLLSEHAWNKMLSQGATTTFEAWGKEDKHNCSLFHPWATAPIIALTQTKFPF